MANYSIADIEGIGRAHAARLRKAGIRTTRALLERCRHRRGRKVLAAATGLREARLLAWTNMADLYRVRGVGSEYAELLEKAGVDTVKELGKRRPEHLVRQLTQVNRRRRLVRRLPGLKRVMRWVAAAKKLRPLVTY
jgi:predicted flap endonuclease-1-like 5' DNA nuclease